MNSSNDLSSGNWFGLYNGTETFWNVPHEMQDKYRFRVRARNEHGFGNWSETGSSIDLTEMTRAMIIAQEHLGLILGLTVPALAILLLCFCYCLCRKFSFEKKKKKLRPQFKISRSFLLKRFFFRSIAEKNEGGAEKSTIKDEATR